MDPRKLFPSLHDDSVIIFFFKFILFLHLAVLGLRVVTQDLWDSLGHVGSLLAPGLLHWECVVLATGPPGKF